MGKGHDEGVLCVRLKVTDVNDVVVGWVARSSTFSIVHFTSVPSRLTPCQLLQSTFISVVFKRQISKQNHTG